MMKNNKGFRLHGEQCSARCGPRSGWSLRHVNPCSCILRMQEVGRGGAEWKPRGNWGRIFLQLSQFNYDNQHPLLTQEDLWLRLP